MFVCFVLFTHTSIYSASSWAGSSCISSVGIFQFVLFSNFKVIFTFYRCGITLSWFRTKKATKFTWGWTSNFIFTLQCRKLIMNLNLWPIACNKYLMQTWCRQFKISTFFRWDNFLTRREAVSAMSRSSSIITLSRTPPIQPRILPLKLCFR